MKLLLMADAAVGLAILRWLKVRHLDDLALVVAASDNEVLFEAKQAGLPCCVFDSAEGVTAFSTHEGIDFDLGVLAWWPKLVRNPLLGLPRHGFINTHPSLLPHNRGKNYNFWALVEEAPFGVSLHSVDEGVDTGDVIAQSELTYDWEDTGETLYRRAQEEMVRLFQDQYASIRELKFTRQRQDLTQGSFHRASEMEQMSEIALAKHYSARELLNLLRARTFPGHPACRFTDGGAQYEVHVTIRKITE